MNYPENLDLKAIARMTIASVLVGLFFAGVARVGLDATDDTRQTVTAELLG